MGLAGTLLGRGTGLAFLANAFFARDGEGGVGIDTLQSLLEGAGVDADFLENGSVSQLIDGREGPLSLIIGSFTTFSGQFRNLGLMAGFGWLGVSLFQSYQRGELRNVFNIEGLGGDPAPAVDPVLAAETAAQTRMEEALGARRLATAEIVAARLNSGHADPSELVAAGPGAHGMIPTDELEPELTPDDPELTNE